MESNATYYPLSYPQKGIWYTEKLYPGTSIGNVAGTLKIKGIINYDKLEKAINLAIEYNDSTRFRIIEINKEPFQYVFPYEFQKIELFDFSNKSRKELFQWEENEAKVPFNLIETELIHFSTFKISENEGGVFVRMHHLISDAWTMSLLCNQVVSFYSALKNGSDLPNRKNYSYIDYILNEEQYKNSDRFIKDHEYWSKKLSSFPELTALKFRSTKFTNTNTRRKTFLLPKKFTSKMHDFCKEYNTSIPALFMAGLTLYINRVTQREDIVIGTMILNRANHIEKNIAGMFISTVPVRIKLCENMNFIAFLQDFSIEWMQSLKHQKYPYELIQKEVRNKNGFSENLYDIVLSYQNAKMNKYEQSEDCETRWLFNGHQTESLTIHINDRDEDGVLIVDYDFLADIFYLKEIEFMHEHIIRLLWHAIDNPIKLVSTLDMMSENEKNKILYDFNNTYVDFTEGLTANMLFEEQAEKTPDNIAILFKDEKLTYRQVNERANQLAAVLRSNGVGSDCIVGVMVKRSIDMIVGILGVMKAGGAFLPIDPEYPKERIKYMLEDSGARTLLTQSGIGENISFRGNILFIDSKTLLSSSNENPVNIAKPDSLAYVIYTSGSTGLPKGVMITHKSYMNATFAWRKEYGLDTMNVRLLQIASFAFDVFAGDFSRALLNGGAMIISSADQQYNPAKLYTLISRHGVNIFESTPALIIPLMKYIYDSKLDISSLKLLIIGSDVLQIEDFRLLVQRFGSSMRVINSYGVTEATIDSSYYEEPFGKCDIKGNTPIGKPLPNTKFLILNKNMQLQPIGIYGELFISGSGVAKGYINKPELTAERFVDNPFFSGEVMYRTGDLARWTSQANVEFLGRADDQVKIRGYRIEIDEITKNILDFQSVENAIIVAKTLGDGKKYLCAYYTSTGNVSVYELKSYLQQKLPNYMIPSYLVQLDEFPLTPNGKIDKNGLPEPDRNAKTAYRAPRNDEERILVEAYKEILNAPRIGIDDDFFELGGDSLAIIHAQIKLFSHNIEISTQDIYDYPTVRLLSKKLSKAESESVVNKVDENYKSVKSVENNIKSIKKGGRPAKSVLLTGATGFLGAHILDELLQETKINVYCLVRKKNGVLPEKRLLDILEYYFPEKYKNILGSRLFVFNGDISKENLGMSKSDYKAVSLKTDMIIHSAALVKHYDTYENFNKTNVYGTEQLIRFALDFDKTLSYISTTSVSGEQLLQKPKKKYKFTEDDLSIGQNYYSNNYVRSKYESEVLLRKFMERNLKCIIFRVGNLTGRYSDGNFQKNVNENAFFKAVKSLCLLGAAPKNILGQEIDFTPVDYAGKAIVKIFIKADSIGKAFHIVNHNTITIGQLLETYRSLGICIEELDSSEFKRLIEHVSNDRIKQSVISGIINRIVETDFFNIANQALVDSEKTRKYLSKLGFSWPAIDDGYILRTLNYLKKEKYLTNERFII